MENENEDIQEVDEELDTSEVAEGEEDTTDWKELALKQQGINKRLKTKLDKIKEEKEPKEPEKPEKKSSEFDYGQKAFLKSYGIDGADERELVKTFMDRTGDDLDTVINDDILKAKLEKLRDAKAVKEAIPTNNPRSANTETNAVDFWLNKYIQSGNLAEVPQELKSKVLDARLKSEEQKLKFGHK